MTTKITLRPGRPADAPACAAILNAWIDATDWMPRCHPPEDVERYHREVVLVDRACTLADLIGEVVGFIAIDTRTALVTALYLARKHRCKGIGTALLDHVKAAHPEGLNLWTFQANTGAQRFYLREGFAEVRRSDGDNEEGLPDILYGWGLKQ
ncbi:MAG: GNAT family N-acetyltransferase [Pseudomonadota bacterium]